MITWEQDCDHVDILTRRYPDGSNHHDISQWKDIEGIEVAHHVQSISNCPGFNHRVIFNDRQF